MLNKKAIRVFAAMAGLVVMIGVQSGCVSMKDYRQTKSQMLWDELEIARLNVSIDSLYDENDALNDELEELDKELESVKREVTELKSENSRLKVENALNE